MMGPMASMKVFQEYLEKPNLFMLILGEPGASNIISSLQNVWTYYLSTKWKKSEIWNAGRNFSKTVKEVTSIKILLKEFAFC